MALITCHKWTFQKLFIFLFSSLQVGRYDLYSPYRRITKDKRGKNDPKMTKGPKKGKNGHVFFP